MADYKVVDIEQLEADLTEVADSIRAKAGTSNALAFPDGFVSAVGAISTDIGSSGGSAVELCTVRLDSVINLDLLAYMSATGVTTATDISGGTVITLENCACNSLLYFALVDNKRVLATEQSYETMINGDYAFLNGVIDLGEELVLGDSYIFCLDGTSYEMICVEGEDGPSFPSSDDSPIAALALIDAPTQLAVRIEGENASYTFGVYKKINVTASGAEILHTTDGTAYAVAIEDADATVSITK